MGFIRPPMHEPPRDLFPNFHEPPPADEDTERLTVAEQWAQAQSVSRAIAADEGYDERMRARNSRVADKFSAYQHDEATITEQEWANLNPDAQLALEETWALPGLRHKLADLCERLAGRLYALADRFDGVA